MSYRSLFAAALVALAALPTAAAAKPKRSETSRTATTEATTASSTGSSRALSVGGLVGAELGDLDGFALRMDGEIAIIPLSPKVSLSGVASVGYSRLSEDVPVFDISWNMFKVIPAARLTIPAAPQISLYGDAGIGFYYGSFTSKWSALGVSYETTDSKTGVMMRFGVGGLYELNPKLRLSGEISVHPYLGDAEATSWTLGVGAMVGL